MLACEISPDQKIAEGIQTDLLGGGSFCFADTVSQGGYSSV
jgi:hypothetical protein